MIFIGFIDYKLNYFLSSNIKKNSILEILAE
jgi:hypothetical protein